MKGPHAGPPEGPVSRAGARLVDSGGGSGVQWCSAARGRDKKKEEMNTVDIYFCVSPLSLIHISEPTSLLSIAFSRVGV